MKALSLDLRERILTTYDKENGTREQVARRFRVSLGMVRPRAWKVRVDMLVWVAPVSIMKGRGASRLPVTVTK